MTEEQQERIFAPFERLGNVVTEDGFGLGLTIVANTVKLLNGSIQVNSHRGQPRFRRLCMQAAGKQRFQKRDCLHLQRRTEIFFQNA